VSAGDEVRAKANRQRSELALDFWRSVLAHPGIDQHRGPNVSEQWADLPDVHRDRIAVIERLLDASDIVGTDGVDAVESGMPLEHCVSESHPAPGGRWHRHVMEHDGVALAEQATCYGRTNVTNATNEYRDSSWLHRHILQQRGHTSHADGSTSVNSEP
jgi:hypothetical protein